MDSLHTLFAAPATIKSLALFGHSNSGKSPLGTALEKEWSGPDCRWLHLDFGQWLRSIWRRETDAGLTPDEMAYLDMVMHGTLLDDGHFQIAAKVLGQFITTTGFLPGQDFILMNGLPRHIGQARDLAALGVIVIGAVHLNCPVEIAYVRKQESDAGRGFEDRSSRSDGDYTVFKRKAESFEQETLPVLKYYENLSVPVYEIPVTVETSPSQMVFLVNQKMKHGRN